MRRPKLTETGHEAFVEMGGWNGSRFEFEGYFPVYKISNGELVILLENVTEDELPESIEDHPNGKALRERRDNKP